MPTDKERQLEAMNREPRTPTRDYLSLECLIDLATSYAEKLAGEPQRGPCNVEAEALTKAVANLRTMVVRLANKRDPR